MSLLLNIAVSSIGSNRLLELGVIKILSSCQWLKPISEITNFEIEETIWIPNSLETHYYLLIPVLKLMVAMLTSLPHHKNLADQVKYFKKKFCLIF